MVGFFVRVRRRLWVRTPRFGAFTSGRISIWSGRVAGGRLLLPRLVGKWASKVRLLALLALTTMPAVFAADPVYPGAQAKIDKLVDGHAKPGETIILSAAEVNAWVA